MTDMANHLRWNTKVSGVTTFVSGNGSTMRGFCKQHGYGTLSPIWTAGKEFWDCEACLEDLTGGSEGCVRPALCELCDKEQTIIECPDCGSWVCANCSVQGLCKDCSEAKDVIGFGAY
jgi:hypothetical protein